MGGGNSKTDACTEGGAVGLNPFQRQREPMISMAGVVIEDALVGVAGKRSTHLLKDVFVAIVFQVSKSDGVAFLQVAEAPGGRYVLKDDAAVVAKHAVRQERLVRAFSGSQVEIKPAVIVEIAEVGAHGKDGAIEVDLCRHILKSAIVVVTIKAGSLGVVGMADLEGANVLIGPR